MPISHLGLRAKLYLPNFETRPSISDVRCGLARLLALRPKLRGGSPSDLRRERNAYTVEEQFPAQYLVIYSGVWLGIQRMRMMPQNYAWLMNMRKWARYSRPNDAPIVHKLRPRQRHGRLCPHCHHRLPHRRATCPLLHPLPAASASSLE